MTILIEVVFVTVMLIVLGPPLLRWADKRFLGIRFESKQNYQQRIEGLRMVAEHVRQATRCR